ncbi:MAG: 5-oxoprolinase [Deltaproteobacteria bacterium]|nr:5-oxoprolinase [Deltaproteobacteria bacterium]
MKDNAVSRKGEWNVFVDTGGTFTDCLARDPAGRETRVKVLSSCALRGRVVRRESERRFRIKMTQSFPDDFVRGFYFRLLGRENFSLKVMAYDASSQVIALDEIPDEDINAGNLFELLSPEEAPLLAARLLTHTPLNAPLPPISMRLATTRGTNALLTRTGTPPILFITRGFADLLEIGTQARPDLFALNIEKPNQLYASVCEVGGRIDARGEEIAPLDLNEIERAAAPFVRDGHRTAAVALLHADKNPMHEQSVAAQLNRVGFEQVCCSADLAPFIKILTRAVTAVVDAYLSPVINSYLNRIKKALEEGSLLAMTSTGGLVRADSYRPKDSLLSGPAGGIAGAVTAGRRAAIERIITFDMGGTSTDVARYDKDFEYVFEHTVGDAKLAAPALAIESVAAGGGSICSCEGVRLTVGPESAGAHPGPACYGASGPLTITDVNLLTGRIDPNRFEIPITKEAAERALDDVVDTLKAGPEELPRREDLLEGFLEIANQRMADAIRGISLRLGYDPQDYAIVAFGGAGPQHAVAVAERLGVRTVLIPAHPGLLSARGLSDAVVERFAEKQVLKALEEIESVLPKILDKLASEAIELLVHDGIDATQTVIRRNIAGLRFMGQDAAVEVDIHPNENLVDTFTKRYTQVFGHWPKGRSIELVSLRTVVSSRRHTESQPRVNATRYEPRPDGTSKILVAGRWRDATIYERDNLRPGAAFEGPCLVLERYSVAVIEPNWKVNVDASGGLVVCSGKSLTSSGRYTRPEAVRLELFTHRFETIARNMGESLRRTAISTNIKERLDFSCAVLDAGGELIVNAPHIPVHLGSLGLCVRSVIDEMSIGPGETVVTNHPAFGGSHLPDVTLISAAYGPGGKLVGYLASRAHHAEIGGSLPGSMPPGATRLVEEGVVIPPTYLVKNGEARWNSVRKKLLGGQYPTRAINDNLADLRAALAANMAGVTALENLAGKWGSDVAAHYMTALKDRAEAAIRAALRKTEDGSYYAREVLDDGAVLSLRITIADDSIDVDFSGSSGVHPGNLNATPAIVRSVVLYVLRLLLDDPLPLNEGLLRASRIHIPPGILNPAFTDDPARAPAVVGGNVETSQRLVNGLVRALGLAAASQGTMNNILFGNDAISYYETVCGGCGAGPGFNGASAVHSHMTNTRITDPEVIEHRYPVRMESFRIRRGSGGDGLFRGGDGARREFHFLEAMTVSILSQHRETGPAGIEGGDSGLPGSQRITKKDGQEIVLHAIDSAEVGPGDRLVLETPGGGGYGRPKGFK